MIKVVKFFQRILNVRSKQYPPAKFEPVIIPRKHHTISRSQVHPSAIKVLYRLHKSGYCAYLVGGSVRDLLLGHKPKDFDVVTDAHPEEIQRLFRNSYIIGRRFKLVHVRFGSEIIEVATFRGSSPEAVGRIQTQEGLLLRDNVYGTLEDDVWRRDFTMNALYYNIADFSVVDYTGGMADLEEKKIRVIGDPDLRYQEDPVRMLRALRLAAKLGFSVERHSADAIKQNKELLSQIPPARLFDKILKIFHSAKSYATFKLLQEYGILPVLFPQVADALDEPSAQEFIELALQNTDERVKQDKPVNSAFLLAVFLWTPMQLRKQYYLQDEECKEHHAMSLAMTDVIQEQLRLISIPRRIIVVMREIWYLQYYLEHARSRRVYKILHHLRFRAAYDFLLLRCQANECSLEELAQWWTDFQDADDKKKELLLNARFKKKARKRRKKKSDDNQELPSTGQ